MRYLAMLVAAMSLLLAGCATTIRSDVTAFHQWPDRLPDKSYVFAAPQPPQDTLEYRDYLDLVRAELGKLGLSEAATPDAAALRVAMQFSTIDQPLRVFEPIDPFWPGPGYWPGRFRHGHPWAYDPWYGFGTSYSPFMYGPQEFRETIRHRYERRLRVSITGANGEKLFDVTVRNSGGQPATAAVMPAMVASAFAGFPGRSGVPHRVALTLEPR